MKLDDLRKEIDIIDEKLMNLLDKRFKLTNEVGKYKLLNEVKLTHSSRENDILEKTKKFNYSAEISEVYLDMFKTSKKYQNEQYFLLGYKLPYSFSDNIHKLISKKLYSKDNNYFIVETCDKANPEEFVKNLILNGNFKGANITNPYKELVGSLVTKPDEIVLETKTCNSIVKRNNEIYGYNTDYYGALYSLKKFNFNVSDKKVIVIGGGATSRTILKVLKDLNAKEVVRLVRNVKEEGQHLLSEYSNYLDYNFIINTTPYGTYPNIEVSSLFPLDQFTNLEGVFDCVYNPVNTPLITEAKKFGIRGFNGLYMLITQAAFTEYLFHNTSVNDNLVKLCDEIYQDILLEHLNIALIGMPYSGKSFIGKKLSEKLNMVYCDSDEILSSDNHSLEEVLKANQTETSYRHYESEVIKSLSLKTGQIISTGGGVVTISENVEYLHLNSIVCYIDTPIEVLLSRIDDTRPLVKKGDDLRKLYNQRKELYHSSADVIVDGCRSIDEIINVIMEKIHEDFGN